MRRRDSGVDHLPEDGEQVEDPVLPLGGAGLFVAAHHEKGVAQLLEIRRLVIGLARDGLVEDLGRLVHVLAGLLSVAERNSTPIAVLRASNAAFGRVHLHIKFAHTILAAHREWNVQRRLCLPILEDKFLIDWHEVVVSGSGTLEGAHACAHLAQCAAPPVDGEADVRLVVARIHARKVVVEDGHDALLLPVEGVLRHLGEQRRRVLGVGQLGRHRLEREGDLERLIGLGRVIIDELDKDRSGRHVGRKDEQPAFGNVVGARLGRRLVARLGGRRPHLDLQLNLFGSLEHIDSRLGEVGVAPRVQLHLVQVHVLHARAQTLDLLFHGRILRLAMVLEDSERLIPVIGARLGLERLACPG
eukprot:scaffold150812_cov27-Tisochrysis_lutea.AAC.3